MKLLAKLVVLSLLLFGGFKAYQHPKVKGLFKTSKKQENPLGFLDDLPEPKPKPVVPKRDPRRARPNRQAPAAQSPVEDQMIAEEAPIEYQNQVPNEELSRVLMQILAAKKLAKGVSLVVSDKRIEVLGQVEDEDSRRKILETVDKGREARTLDGSNLIVTN